MYNLLMDTSTDYLFVAIVDHQFNGEWYLEKQHKKHSELIIPTLESLMTKMNISMKDIRDVIVTLGPGSFTGIRLALTVAKTIGFALGKKVYGISSLEAYSLLDQPSIVFLDARANRFYMGHYHHQQCIVEDTIVTLEQAEAYVKANPAMNTLWVDRSFPSPQSLIQSMIKLKQPEHLIKDIHSLSPKYLKTL
jgi:tRNA threonylcarbamoyladenosine biosynthesis protein TsaB